MLDDGAGSWYHLPGNARTGLCRLGGVWQHSTKLTSVGVCRSRARAAGPPPFQATTMPAGVGPLIAAWPPLRRGQFRVSKGVFGRGRQMLEATCIWRMTSA